MDILYDLIGRQGEAITWSLVSARAPPFIAGKTFLVSAATWWPFGELLKGRMTQVADGQIDWPGMCRNGERQGDLDQTLRQAGLMNLGTVRSVFLERNGDLSVILRS